MKIQIKTLLMLTAITASMMHGSAHAIAKADEEKTCNLWQVCKNHEGITPGTLPDSDCKDGGDVSQPVFVEGNFAPSVMDERGSGDMQTACPFYEIENPGGKLCCNSDTAKIMVTNYAQLDGVFATDSPICAANLKRMWCEYACNPRKADFLVQKGKSPPPPGFDFDFTNVQTTINDAYACTVYTSCKQTSFIAAAGVSSAVGFLNFLGTNGAPYSLSFINFTETNTDTPGYLDSEAIPCQQAVNDTLWGYQNMHDSSCSFCAKACPPPVVSDKIGFLDGFSWKIVGYSYLGFILFTIGFQVLTHCWLKQKKLDAARAAAQANQTGSTAVGTSAADSFGGIRQGRQLNATTSSASDMGSRRQTTANQSQSQTDFD